MTNTKVTLHSCPKCGAPLSHHRFAPTALCTFCGITVTLEADVVKASVFLDALARQQARPDGPGVVTLLGQHYRVLKRLHVGQYATVDLAERTARPTERVVLKTFHAGTPAALPQNEWEALTALQDSEARGAGTFLSRVPEAVAFSAVAGEPFRLAYRWAPGFGSSLAEAQATSGGGIPPIAAVWVWRRVLEALGFIHDSGLAHGAVLAQHCMVQDGEHGLKLVGFSHAKKGAHAGDDVAQSARMMLSVTHPSMPASLAQLASNVADAKPNHWPARRVHEELGALARREFGPPSFHPLFSTDERS